MAAFRHRSLCRGNATRFIFGSGPKVDVTP